MQVDRHSNTLFTKKNPSRLLSSSHLPWISSFTVGGGTKLFSACFLCSCMASKVKGFAHKTALNRRRCSALCATSHAPLAEKH